MSNVQTGAKGPPDAGGMETTPSVTTETIILGTAAVETTAPAAVPMADAPTALVAIETAAAATSVTMGPTALTTDAMETTAPAPVGQETTSASVSVVMETPVSASIISIEASRTELTSSVAKASIAQANGSVMESSAMSPVEPAAAQFGQAVQASGMESGAEDATEQTLQMVELQAASDVPVEGPKKFLEASLDCVMESPGRQWMVAEDEARKSVKTVSESVEGDNPDTPPQGDTEPFCEDPNTDAAQLGDAGSLTNLAAQSQVESPSALICAGQELNSVSIESAQVAASKAEKIQSLQGEDTAAAVTADSMETGVAVVEPNAPSDVALRSETPVEPEVQKVLESSQEEQELDREPSRGDREKVRVGTGDRAGTDAEVGDMAGQPEDADAGVKVPSVKEAGAEVRGGEAGPNKVASSMQNREERNAPENAPPECTGSQISDMEQGPVVQMASDESETPREPKTQEYMCKEISSTSDEPMDATQETESKTQESKTSNVPSAANRESPQLKILNVCSLASPCERRKEPGRGVTEPAATPKYRYQCQLCTNVLPTLEDALSHIHSVHSVKVHHYYSCICCSHVCESSADMQRHMQQRHPDSDLSLPLRIQNQDKFFRLLESTVDQASPVSQSLTVDAAKNPTSEDDGFIRGDARQRRPARPVGPVRPIIAGRAVGPELPVVAASSSDPTMPARPQLPVGTATPFGDTPRSVSPPGEHILEGDPTSHGSQVIIRPSSPTIINIPDEPAGNEPVWSQAESLSSQPVAKMGQSTSTGASAEKKPSSAMPALFGAPTLQVGSRAPTHPFGRTPPPLIQMRGTSPGGSGQRGMPQPAQAPPAHMGNAIHRPTRTGNAMRGPTTGTVRPMMVSPPRQAVPPQQVIDDEEEEVSREAFSVFNIGPRLRMPAARLPPAPRPVMEVPSNVAKWRQFQARRPSPQRHPQMPSRSVHPAFMRGAVQPPFRGPPNISVGLPHGLPTNLTVPSPAQMLQPPGDARQCPYCNFRAPDVDTLHTHIIDHEKQNVLIYWTCPYCPGNMRMTKAVVERHILVTHPGKKVMYIPFGIKV